MPLTKTSTKWLIGEQCRDLMYTKGSDGWNGFNQVFILRQALDTNSAVGRRQQKAMKNPKVSFEDALDLIHNTDTVR